MFMEENIAVGWYSMVFATTSLTLPKTNYVPLKAPNPAELLENTSLIEVCILH